MANTGPKPAPEVGGLEAILSNLKYIFPCRKQPDSKTKQSYCKTLLPLIRTGLEAEMGYQSIFGESLACGLSRRA